MNKQRTTFLLFFALTAILLISTQPLFSAVIVDPNGGGATDLDPADPATWTSNTDAYVGKTAHGVLRLDGGSQIESYEGYIGDGTGSIGSVTVDGAGSAWTNSDDLHVGYQGSGTMNISGGGAVGNSRGYIGYTSSSTGSVTVDGAGSTWTNSRYLYVGRYGSGTLDITNGGLVTVAGTTNVGNSNAINFNGGTLDTGLLWADDANLTGTGTILLHGVIADQALAFDSPDNLAGYYRTINSLPDQNITVNYNIDGRGSLGAGLKGTGSLTISSGLVVTSMGGYIGQDATAIGTVSVDGSGSTWTNTDDLYIGYDGSGTLDISAGGVVSSFGGYVGDGSSSTGSVTVDGRGSAWTNSGELHIGRYGNGMLDITGGAAVSNSRGWIARYSGSTSSVTVDGYGSTWTSSNGLYVGLHGSGMLDIANRGLVRVIGTLTIDYNGDGDSFINIDTGGMLALSGDTDDSLFDFLGQIDGTGAIRYWEDSISDWADITAATYGDDYTLSYLDGYTVLNVGTPAPSIVGDANHDGVVDDADAMILATHWLTASDALWEMGDFNGDGAVNGIDATLLAANWTNAEHTTVPEPSTLALIAIGIVVLLASLWPLQADRTSHSSCSQS